MSEATPAPADPITPAADPAPAPAATPVADPANPLGRAPDPAPAADPNAPPEWLARLPDDLKAVVESCCRAVNDSMLAEYTARNQAALDTLRHEHGIEFRPLPADVLDALRQASIEVLEQTAARDPFAAKVYASVKAFRASGRAWTAVSEQAYLQQRGDWS